MCRVQINAYDGRPVCHVHDKLVLAAAEGNVELVKKWLDAGADVNHKDVRGWTALHAVSDTLHD